MNNNKKILLVFLFATILALLTVFFITKYNTNERTINTEPTIKENLIEEINVDNNTEVTKPTLEETKVTPEITKPKKQIQNKTELPEIKKIVVEENKEEVKEDLKEEKLNEDNGIQKIEGSNVIEITREFKVETPSKYSFK